MLEFDENVFLLINSSLSGPLATRFFSLITHLGNALVLAVIILPALYFFNPARFRRHAVALILSVAFSGLVVNVMKIVVDRPRPPEHFAAQNIDVHAPSGEPSDRSFPSGHTQTAVGTATYLSMLYPLSATVYLILAGLVGLSRIAIGVHFPLDVIVGAAIGAICSFAGCRLNRRRLRSRGVELR